MTEDFIFSEVRKLVCPACHKKMETTNTNGITINHDMSLTGCYAFFEIVGSAVRDATSGKINEAQFLERLSKFR